MNFKIKLLCWFWGIPIIRYPLSYYVKLLKENKPFSFARFGDGEWSAMLGYHGANCDGHQYFPELGNDLCTAALKPHPYFFGMQGKAVKSMGKGIRRFMKSNSAKRVWHDADVFHYANNDGTLLPFIEQLRSMPLLCVGPHHLRAIDNVLFNYEHFVEVPSVNCYLAVNEILRDIRAILNKNSSLTILFSASMTTNVIIDNLYPEFGATCSMIDCGSLWDVYVGVNSRSGYKKEIWKELIRKNTGTQA